MANHYEMAFCKVPELFLRREYLTGILFYAKLSIVAERVLLWLSW